MMERFHCFMKQGEETYENIKSDYGEKIYINKDKRINYIKTKIKDNHRHGNTRTQRHTRFVQQGQSYLPARNRGRNKVATICDGKRNIGTKLGDMSSGGKHRKHGEFHDDGL